MVARTPRGSQYYYSLTPVLLQSYSSLTPDLLQSYSLLSSAVLEAEVGEPPHVAQADSVGHAGEGEVPLAAPGASLSSLLAALAGRANLSLGIVGSPLLGCLVRPLLAGDGS